MASDFINKTANSREKNNERCFDIFSHAPHFSLVIKALATNLILMKLMSDLQIMYPYPFQHNNDHHSVVKRGSPKKS